MNVVLFSSLPLADRLPHRAQVLSGLVAREPRRITLVSTRPGLLAHAGEAWRKLADLSDWWERARGGSEKSRTGPTLESLAAELGVPVRRYATLRDPELEAWMAGESPDLAYNLAGEHVPTRLLQIPRHGVVGGHYARLPDIRGGDSVRWSIYLDRPLVVSHLRLAAGLDLGPILRRETLPVKRGDRIVDLRGRCQEAAARGHLEVFDRIRDGGLEMHLQLPADGQLYHRMGRFLRARVDRKLAEGEYAHQS